jgi:pescadillo
VDLAMMDDFLAFYVVFLKFVNYRLYTDVGLEYPPKVLESKSYDVDGTSQGFCHCCLLILYLFSALSQVRMRRKAVSSLKEEEQEVNQKENEKQKKRKQKQAEEQKKQNKRKAEEIAKMELSDDLKVGF